MKKCESRRDGFGFWGRGLSQGGVGNRGGVSILKFDKTNQNRCKDQK